jgi:phosphoserine phosphatase
VRVAIVRLIAEPAAEAAVLSAIAGAGFAVARSGRLAQVPEVLELACDGAAPAALRAALVDVAADLLVTECAPEVPRVFVSDMDSTIIQAECIDELADFAGLKPQIAAITERAMQGELDFAAALTERVRLLAGLGEGAIAQCLTERIAPMPGAATLVATLKAQGCFTVLVTGGFHQFADPVAEQLGFERVVANRLAVAGGALTGDLVGGIVDSAIKAAVLREEVAGRGSPALATGDGANDIPMLQAADYGIAYHAKPKARAAANGAIATGDLTAVLRLLGIAESDWIAA